MQSSLSEKAWWRFLRVVKLFLLVLALIISYVGAENERTSNLFRSGFDAEGYSKAARMEGIPWELVEETIIKKTGGVFVNNIRTLAITLMYFAVGWILIEIIYRAILYVVTGETLPTKTDEA